MDKKYWKTFIVAIIILGSLYFNYRQYHEIKYYKYEIVNQQRSICREAYRKIDDIVADGYRALATGQQDKAREYLAGFNDSQNILSRYILRIPIPGGLREFYDVSDIFRTIHGFSKDTMQEILDNGWADENRAAFENYLRQYTRMGERFKEICDDFDDKEFTRRIKPALQEFTAEFEQYMYGGAPLFNDLPEEEQEAILEASRRYDEEREAIIKAFEPEALRIARDFLDDEIEGCEELGVNGYGYDSKGNITMEMEFRKGNIVKNVEVTTDGYISSYSTEYNPGRGSGSLPVQKENLTDREAVEKAEEFLAERLGIENADLESSGRMPGGLFQACFKETVDGIIIGKKSQIDVTVSLEDGTVLDFFRSLNTPEENERIREAISTPPTITRDQAKGLIGKHNSKVSAGELYYRYDDILAWRFEVFTSGVRQFIYIDAHTGEEVEIMRAERI